MTAEQIAQRLHVNAATVRRWRLRGCPLVRTGGRGPGRAAQFDLDAVVKWRGQATTVGLQAEEVLQRIAVALLAALEQGHADIRAGVLTEDAAALLLVVFEFCSKEFGHQFEFDEQPIPIRALAREL